MDAFCLAASEAFEKKIGLQQWLTAREGHTATRFLEEHIILADFAHEVVGGYPITYGMVFGERTLTEFAFLLHRLGLIVLALRVVAPSATQRAPFHEHGGPYPWPVVYGIAFDVEDKSVHKCR